MLFHFFSQRLSGKKRSQAPSTRRIAFETLEDRQLLSLTNVAPVEVDIQDVASNALVDGPLEYREPITPYLIVNSDEDVLDHTDDFYLDGGKRKITLRDALDYIGKRFDLDSWIDNTYYWIQDAFVEVPESQQSSYPARYDNRNVYVSGVYDTIYFDEGISTIKLTSPLVIDKNVTINGKRIDSTGMSDYVVLDGTIEITEGGVSTVSQTSLIDKTSGSLTLKNLTLQNGVGVGNGGAINNASGKMTIDSCAFKNNAAVNGGAIYTNGGVVNMTNSFFNDNTATNDGGAIYTNGGVVNMTNSFLEDNTASNYGGALAVAGGQVNVYAHGTEVWFEGNSAALGGAVYNRGIFTTNEDGSGGAVMFNLNKATGVIGEDGTTLTYGSGGAIYNSTPAIGTPGDIMIYNASFDQNSADKYGGAISNYGSAITQECYFRNNKAATGGAIQSAGTLGCYEAEFSGNVAKNTLGVYLNSAKTDLGGNGGAVYISKNASNLSKDSTASFSGVEFNENKADNAGGAIDCVSGGFTFIASSSENYFRYNEAGMIGGAIVYASPFDVNTYATLTGVSCVFTYNESYYAPDIAISSSFSATDAQALADFYGVQNSAVETFTRYKNSGSTLSFEDLLIDMPEGTTSIVVSSDVYSATLTAGQSVDLANFIVEQGVANTLTKIQYYATDAPDVKFNLYYSARSGESLSLYAQRIVLDETTNAVQYSFRIGGLNDCAVSQWRINWGDGTQTQVVDKLGFTLNANHLYANYGVYDVALSVTTLAGSVVDFGTVGKIFNEDPTAPFEGEEVVFASLDDELTDSLFNDLDWLDDAI